MLYLIDPFDGAVPSLSLDSIFIIGGLIGGIIILWVMYCIYYDETHDFDPQHRLDRNGGNT